MSEKDEKVVAGDSATTADEADAREGEGSIEARACACGCGQMFVPEKPGYRFRPECLAVEGRTECIFGDCHNSVGPGRRYCDDCYEKRVKGRCGDCGKPCNPKHQLCGDCHRDSQGWTGKDGGKGSKDGGKREREGRKGPRKCQSRECRAELAPDYKFDHCPNCHGLWLSFESPDNRADEIEERIGKATGILGDEAVAKAIAAYEDAKNFYGDGDGLAAMESLHEASVRLDLAFVLSHGGEDEHRYGFANDYRQAKRIIERVKVLLGRGDIRGAERICQLADNEVTAVTACGAVSYAEKTLAQVSEFKVDLGKMEEKDSYLALITRTAKAIRTKLAKRHYREAKSLGRDLQKLVGDVRRLEAFEPVLEAEERAKEAQRKAAAAAKRQENLKKRQERKPATAAVGETATRREWRKGESGYSDTESDTPRRKRGGSGGQSKKVVKKAKRQPTSTKGRGGRRQRRGGSEGYGEYDED